ncbi:MAG: AAA family ATPase, partial [Chloroflexota bacterium]
MQGIKLPYQEHHSVEITDEAIESASNLSARYIPDRFLPDKAIDLIDEASARLRMYKSPESAQVRRITEEIEHVQGEISRGEDDNVDPQVIEDYKLRLENLQQTLEDYQSNWNEETGQPRLMAEDIAEVVAMWTGIPVTRMASDEAERLMGMEDAMHKRIVGQDEAIVSISKAVRRARAGLKDPRRPIGSFMFLGPTGVGKTELTKTLAEFLFGSEEALIQLDMSEFMERHSVARLVGAPPGYVGYEDAGQLTEAVRRRPYSIVVFDEIEKAHPEAFNMLLQVMEEGKLTDARGRSVDFRNTIVVMTSNVGADMIKRQSRLGFAPIDTNKKDEEDYTDMSKNVMDRVRRTFRPEFLNRVDATIIFRPLTQEEIKSIVDLELDKLRARLIEHAITLGITEEALTWLATEGYDSEYGARPLRRLIVSAIEDELSEGILSGAYPVASTVTVTTNEESNELKLIGEGSTETE